MITIPKPKTPAPYEISDELDYQTRTNPKLMTRLLRKSVPVLDAADWRITKVGYGYCETLLPLNDATTNQHGTHQAALISLSGDYTGGMALTTLLKGFPIAGVHPAAPNSVSLWLASMDVKYLQPSTGHLTGRCEIPLDLANKLADRYRQGKRILASLTMVFESNGEIVAEGKMKYFAQPTAQLMDCTTKISPLFSNKIKASARMIAGVRAGTQTTANRRPGEVLRIDCPHATAAAGPHGLLLAKRLSQALPQLSDMVMARNQHVDAMLDSMDDVEQLVLIGAGLDMRPFRFAKSLKSNRSIDVFELDLPEMLSERERVIGELNLAGVAANRRTVAANFLHDDIETLLVNTPGFDRTKTTAFVYEGCSMYFDGPTNRRLISSIANVMGNSKSKLWVDFVSLRVVEGPAVNQQVADFLSRMTDLGEAFIYGVDDPATVLNESGFKHVKSTTARDYLKDDSESAEVLQQYWFTESWI